MKAINFFLLVFICSKLLSQNVDIIQFTDSKISVDYSSENPNLFCIDTNDIVHLVYTTNATNLYYINSKTKQPISLFTGNDTIRVNGYIKIDSNQIIHIFYKVSMIVQDENYTILKQNYKLFHLEINNSKLSKLVLITSSNFLLSMIDFEFDKNMNIFLTYLKSRDQIEPDLGDQDLYFQYYINNSFSNPILVDSNLSTINYVPKGLNIEVDKNGPIIIGKYYNSKNNEELVLWKANKDFKFNKYKIYEGNKHFNTISTTKDKSDTIYILFGLDKMYMAKYYNDSILPYCSVEKLNSKYPNISPTSLVRGVSDIHISTYDMLCISAFNNESYYPSEIDNDYYSIKNTTNGIIEQLIIDNKGYAVGLLHDSDSKGNKQFYLMKSKKIIDPLPPTVNEYFDACNMDSDSFIVAKGQNIKWYLSNNLNNTYSNIDTLNISQLPTDLYSFFVTQTISNTSSEPYLVKVNICNDSVVNIKKEDIDNINSKIFPNPFNDYIEIELIDNINMNFKIIDSYGNTIISEQKINSCNNKLNTKPLKSGIYYIVIFDSNKILKTQKIIKMK